MNNTYMHNLTGYEDPNSGLSMPSDHLLTGGNSDLLAGSSNLVDALLGGGASSNLSSAPATSSSVPMSYIYNAHRPDNYDDDGMIDLEGDDIDMYGDQGTPMSDPLGDDPEGWNDYEPPIHGDPVDEYDPADPGDFDWPEFDIPEWDIPGIPDQNFEFEDFPNEAPDFPEFEKAKRKKIPMGFYDAGSAASGFSAGDLNVNLEDFLANQVAQEAGVTHPLQQALLGR